MPEGSRNLASAALEHDRAAAHPPLSFSLQAVPPFRLDLTVWTLRRRPENILDRWDGHTYRRALSINGQIVHLAAEQIGSPEHPRLRVTAHGSNLAPGIQPALRSTLEHMLGLKIDLRDFYSFATEQKHLRSLISGFIGFKPPRYPTIFEALLNAISCQQVSLNVGMMLLNRLVENFGRPSPVDRLAHACPLPADLAEASPGALRAFGYSQNKERAILELSRSVASGKLNLESLRELDDAAALEKLLAIRGVGRWSAEYALLRGMGRLQIFPGDDVGGWRNLQKHLHLRARPDYAKTRKLLTPWKNYAGLIYFHFLLDGLRTRGILP
jgi:DNA-3-methyladenine glycosylase II